jgi:hypothetical protein
MELLRWVAEGSNIFGLMVLFRRDDLNPRNPGLGQLRRPSAGRARAKRQAIAAASYCSRGRRAWAKAYRAWKRDGPNPQMNPRLRQTLQAPPCRGVSRFSQADRRRRSGRSRRSHHHGQLRHPQNRSDQKLVGSATALPCALHADIGLLDPSSRSMVRRAHPKAVRRGVHTSTKKLELDIRAFIECHNKNPKPYRWTKSADEILASVKRFCQKLNGYYAANFRFT